MKAFLNGSGDVMATASDEDLDLVGAKLLMVGIEIMVDPAPTGLIAKDVTRPTWHKKGIQDGSDLSDYTLQSDNVDYVAALKSARNAEIDARSAELVEVGFNYGGRLHSMKLQCQVHRNRLRSAPAPGFPYTVLTPDNGGLVIADQADFDAYLAAEFSHVDGVLDAGMLIKDDIDSQTTVAGIDAIVDAR